MLSFTLFLQGDVVALIDANGTQVVEYGYDAWGNLVYKSGNMASTLGTVNPFRYRGYVYDEEMSMYYLGKRYYSPKEMRFCVLFGICSFIVHYYAYKLNIKTSSSDVTDVCEREGGVRQTGIDILYGIGLR